MSSTSLGHWPVNVGLPCDACVWYYAIVQQIFQSNPSPTVLNICLWISMEAPFQEDLLPSKVFRISCETALPVHNSPIPEKEKLSFFPFHFFF